MSAATDQHRPSGPPGPPGPSGPSGPPGRDVLARLGRLRHPWNLYVLDQRDTVAEYGAAHIDAVRTTSGTTACLRVVRDGRSGTVTATSLTDPEGMAATAEALARYGPPNDEPHQTTGPSATPAPAARADTPDERAEPTALLRLLKDRLARLQRDTKLLMHGTATVQDQTVRLAGADLPYSIFHRRVCHVSLVVEGQTNPATRFQWVHWGRDLALDADAERWFRYVAAWPDLPERSCDDIGDLDILLAPPAVHTLLTPLVGSLSGAAVAEGRSFLRGRMGERLFHPGITLADDLDGNRDGDEDRGWPAGPACDDEGVPPAPLTLIDRGVVAGLYHSRRSATQLGANPTGHGFRGTALRRKPSQPIAPAASRVRLAPGAAGFADLISGIRRGVLIESFIGANQHSALSPRVEGRIRLGFLIEDGQVVARLRSRPVSLDVFTVLGGEAFVAASAECRPAGRTWTGRLPFLLTRAAQRPARPGEEGGPRCTT